MTSHLSLVELEKRLMEISGAIFSIDPCLDLKEKAEQEALSAIEYGTTNTIEAFQKVWMR